MRKDEIWQNPEIFSCVKHLAQNWDFWALWTCEGWNLTTSRNFELFWKFGLKMRFLITLDLANDEIWKSGKILKFLVPVKIWIKIDISYYSGPWKAEIWQNADILSQVENLAQNRHFWPLRTWEGWSLAKFRNFQSRWKFGLNWEFDHSGPAKDEIWLNPEILSRLENLAQNWHFWPLWIFKGWNLAKFRNFQSRWKFG